MYLMPTLHRPAAQILLTIIISALCTYFSGYFPPSVWNALWMFGLPTLIAIVLNKDVPMRIIMGFFLLVFSYFSTAVAGITFGLDH